MRRPFTVSLIAAAALIGLALMAGGTWAQNNDLNIQFHGFQDSRGVTVLSPTVDLSQDYTERTSLRVTFGVDAISAASDSCARCHQQGVRSRRQDASFSLTRKLEALKWTFGGAYSQENFYRATTGMTSLSRDLAKGNTTVAGGFSFSLNQPLLLRLWGFHDKKPHLPTDSELAAVRPLVDYRHLQVDEAAHSVRFARSGVELDLGGIAKGFAVEVAANTLRQRALAGFIDAGGNQYLLGTPPGKHTWTVGIKDPDHPTRLLGVIDTTETSVSTSADYATFVEINGRKFGHVLDPHTLYPSDAALSVTILSRDGTMADAMSKAVFILGPSAGLTLVDSLPGMSAVIAYRRPDGTVALAISPRLRPVFHPIAS